MQQPVPDIHLKYTLFTGLFTVCIKCYHCQLVMLFSGIIIKQFMLYNTAQPSTRHLCKCLQNSHITHNALPTQKLQTNTAVKACRNIRNE